MGVQSTFAGTGTDALSVHSNSQPESWFWCARAFGHSGCLGDAGMNYGGRRVRVPRTLQRNSGSDDSDTRTGSRALEMHGNRVGPREIRNFFIGIWVISHSLLQPPTLLTKTISFPLFLAHFSHSLLNTFSFSAFSPEKEQQQQ